MSTTAFARFGLILGAAMLCGVAVAGAQERDPRVGSWIANQGPGAVGLRTSYEDLGDGRVRIRLSGLVVDARCDGEDYPFTGRNGQPAGPTYACRIVGPRTVEYTYKQTGREPWSTSTGLETVSDDGETLTHAGVRRDETGALIEGLQLIFVREVSDQ